MSWHSWYACIYATDIWRRLDSWASPTGLPTESDGTLANSLTQRFHIGPLYIALTLRVQCFILFCSRLLFSIGQKKKKVQPLVLCATLSRVCVCVCGACKISSSSLLYFFSWYQSKQEQIYISSRRKASFAKNSDFDALKVVFTKFCHSNQKQVFLYLGLRKKGQICLFRQRNRRFKIPDRETRFGQICCSPQPHRDWFSSSLVTSSSPCVQSLCACV